MDNEPGAMSEFVDIADAVFDLVDMVAKSLGYEYVTLQTYGKDSRRCACVFRCARCYDYLKMKTADGRLEIVELDVPSSNGKIPLSMYYGFARELYRILDNCEEVYVKDKKLEAGMVPEFMMQCVLNGIS